MRRGHGSHPSYSSVSVFASAQDSYQFGSTDVSDALVKALCNEKSWRASHSQSHFGCPIHTRSLRMSGVEGARSYDTLMPSHLKRYQTEGSYHFSSPSVATSAPRFSRTTTPASPLKKHWSESVSRTISASSATSSCRSTSTCCSPSRSNNSSAIRCESSREKPPSASKATANSSGKPATTTSTSSPTETRRETQVHPPQPRTTQPRRQARRLAMEQLSPLSHRRTKSSRNRIRVDVEQARKNYVPIIAIRPR